LSAPATAPQRAGLFISLLLVPRPEDDTSDMGCRYGKGSSPSLGRKITLGKTNVQRKLRVVTDLRGGPSLRAFRACGSQRSGSFCDANQVANRSDRLSIACFAVLRKQNIFRAWRMCADNHDGHAKQSRPKDSPKDSPRLTTISAMPPPSSTRCELRNASRPRREATRSWRRAAHPDKRAHPKGIRLQSRLAAFSLESSAISGGVAMLKLA
jgi:hypothetical protein